MVPGNKHLFVLTPDGALFVSTIIACHGNLVKDVLG
jgi:hypothetical protein